MNHILSEIWNDEIRDLNNFHHVFFSLLCYHLQRFHRKSINFFDVDCVFLNVNASEISFCLSLIQSLSMRHDFFWHWIKITVSCTKLWPILKKVFYFSGCGKTVRISYFLLYLSPSLKNVKRTVHGFHFSLSLCWLSEIVYLLELPTYCASVINKRSTHFSMVWRNHNWSTILNSIC